jgi:branched-chain amino acid transport system substrate-binding protein
LTGIYELGNQAYAKTLWQTIQAEFETLGGDASQTFTFTSGETDLRHLMAQVTASRPEAVVFIAPSIDTALMIQYGRQQGLAAKLYSSGWAGTEVFLEKGGRAIEGVELVLTFSDQHSDPAFKKFVQRFKTHYGREPTFSAAYSYEAVLVLAQALEETNGQAEGLPDALKRIKKLEGLQGKISLDEYGDVNRDVYIAVVRNRQFEIIYAVMVTGG